MRDIIVFVTEQWFRKTFLQTLNLWLQSGRLHLQLRVKQYGRKSDKKENTRKIGVKKN